MLEERGFSTVAIASVRAQAEKTRPPRALWTTSQLGRPLGEPGDAMFQRRVLLAALGLLVRTDGPVILEDFNEDPPGWLDTPGWRAPALVGPNDPPETPDAWAAAFGAALSAWMPLWRTAQARFGRTTVGLSFQASRQPGQRGSRLVSTWPASCPPCPELDTPALALRMLSDDIKALYGEAAQAEGSAPSARQIDAWFWRQTVAGRLLIALRAVAMASENNALKTVGGRFFVPAYWLP